MGALISSTTTRLLLLLLLMGRFQWVIDASPALSFGSSPSLRWYVHGLPVVPAQLAVVADGLGFADDDDDKKR